MLDRIREDVLPMLRSQLGFIDCMPLVPTSAMEYGRVERILILSLWTDERLAEKYQREMFPVIQELLAPLVMLPTHIKAYTVDGR